jgi:adenylosuccinate lyase
MSTLSDRYASEAMRAIWSAESKIRAERKLWIAVARFQSKALAIPEKALQDYEKVADQVDLNRIDIREKKTRHDVKARIDEFNELAGHQYIHLGMTSRDLTENIEAFQIRSALLLIQERTAALLFNLGEIAKRYAEQPIVARTHNVPAQLTTLGKRFATFGEELLFAFDRLNNLIERYPNRGIKGPVGTEQDSRDLIGNDHDELEKVIAKSLGFTKTLDATSQIYPRSFDFDVVSALLQLAAAPSNLATSIRLMAGAGLATEGFKAGQTGSSAMPHKMNSRSSERINGLTAVLSGYLTMISQISGAQWNEGDVSDSVVRRVALSDSFYALDGIIETALTILNEFGIFEARISAEIESELPFLATTKFLMAAIKNGAKREVAHEALKELATKALLDRQSGKPTSLIEAIAADARIPLDKPALEILLANRSEFLGNAELQTARVITRIKNAISKFPNAATYKPGEIR